MKNITKADNKRQFKITTEMNGKGLTVNAGLLPVLNFMGKLMFRERVQGVVHKKRGANAKYQFVVAVQMVVIGLIAGATSMAEVVKVWSDEVLKKMAGWKAVTVDTMIREMLRKFFGKEPDTSVNPDECVAIGAAIQGALLGIW